jgi:molybdopterin-guanine dinucleotide biosynthesis protein A
MERLVTSLEALDLEEIVIAAGAPERYETFGRRVVGDRVSGRGPLGGLDAVFDATNADIVLVVAVDMPYLDTGLLKDLVSQAKDGAGVVPEVNGQLEPLVALYPRRAAPLVRTQIRHGDFSMRGFATAAVHARLVHVWAVDESRHRYFTNWNHPWDLPAEAARPNV